MTLSDYIAQMPHGAVSRLSASIGAHVPDVSRWISGKRPVPVERCVAIERATAGAVTRRDLRPHDWHLIWPELAETTPTPAAKEGAHA